MQFEFLIYTIKPCKTMKTKTIYFFVICLTIITHPVVAQKHITKAEVQKVATNALRMLNNSNDPYDPSHNPSHCIPPEDMNYYLSKFNEIMLHYKPDGKEPVSALYMYSVKTSIPGAVLFFLYIDYAIIHCEFIGWDE